MESRKSFAIIMQKEQKKRTQEISTCITLQGRSKIVFFAVTPLLFWESMESHTSDSGKWFWTCPVVLNTWNRTDLARLYIVLNTPDIVHSVECCQRSAIIGAISSTKIMPWYAIIDILSRDSIIHLHPPPSPWVPYFEYFHYFDFQYQRLQSAHHCRHGLEL